MTHVNQKLEFETEREGIKFSLASPWSNEAITKLCNVIRNPSPRAEEDRLTNGSNSNSAAAALSGRGVVTFVDVPDIGAVAVKQYCRGGLLRLFIRNRYLNASPSRPAIELKILQEAQNLGVNVPTPLGFAIEGSLVYKAWLFTREIPKHHSLSEIAMSDLTRIPPLIDKLVSQVSILIASEIRHVDLHPGNVVVSEDGEVFLLDFDKAKNVKLEKKDLRDQYVWRWRRAVIKHKLPEQLSELFCLGLRRSAITG